MMRRNYLVFCCFLLFFVASVSLHAESKMKNVTIVYTNNTMGRVEPCRH